MADIVASGCLLCESRKQQDPSFSQSDSLHKLNRPQQVILCRLRIGHNRLNSHMYNKFKVGESEVCPCNAYVMTAEHLLQHCQLHDALRRDMWPEQHRHHDCRTSTAALPTIYDALRWDMWPAPILLRGKLYGHLEELRRTTAFVRACPSSVLRRRRTRCESRLFFRKKLIEMTFQ